MTRFLFAACAALLLTVAVGNTPLHAGHWHGGGGWGGGWGGHYHGGWGGGWGRGYYGGLGYGGWGRGYYGGWGGYGLGYRGISVGIGVPYGGWGYGGYGYGYGGYPYYGVRYGNPYRAWGYSTVGYGSVYGYSGYSPAVYGSGYFPGGCVSTYAVPLGYSSYYSPRMVIDSTPALATSSYGFYSTTPSTAARFGVINSSVGVVTPVATSFSSGFNPYRTAAYTIPLSNTNTVYVGNQTTSYGVGSAAAFGYPGTSCCSCANYGGYGYANTGW